MARDGALPFSTYLHKIFQPTKSPLATVALVFVLESLLLLLQLLSSTAFDAIVATSTFGFQLSYFMPILFRCTVARYTFVPGKFNLGSFGQFIAVVSSAWLFMTSIIMIFPLKYPVTVENMNYSILIIGGVSIIATIYWIVSARHWFVGPKRITSDAVPLLPMNATNQNTE